MQIYAFDCPDCKQVERDFKHKEQLHVYTLWAIMNVNTEFEKEKREAVAYELVKFYKHTEWKPRLMEY